MNNLCPHGACFGECLMKPPAAMAGICPLWSPLQKTCIMSSKWRDNEDEEAMLGIQKRQNEIAGAYGMEDALKSLEGIKWLENGWADDNDGVKPDEEVVEMVERNLERFKKRPFIPYPMLNGGLTVEWPDEPMKMAAVIHPDGYGWIILKDGTAIKANFNLDGWDRLHDQWQIAMNDGAAQ